MKTLNITIKIITVFLLAGALFLSCELAEPDTNGTLIIALPGSGSARAAGGYGGGADNGEAEEPDSDFLEYITGLYFSVECRNETDEIIKREFKYGTKASISLSPGAWYVTVYVLDKEKEEPVVGEGATEEPVIIEAGKTTTAPKIPIKIDYDGNEGTIEWPEEEEWEEYGLGGLKQPDGTKVVYIVNGTPGTLADNTSDIKDEIKDLDKLSISSEHNNYSNHLIVILKIAEDIKNEYTTENLYNDIKSSGYDLEREDPVRFSKTTDDKTYIISPQLIDGYIIILVRAGESKWY